MKFRNEFYFLSNMSPATVWLNIYGQTYQFTCAEAAFQACKCVDPKDIQQFLGIDGYTAKKLGRRVQLRPDWEKIKTNIMLTVVTAKFSQNLYLLQQLRNVRQEIVEENTWHDTFWGVCNGVGENYLGRILMAIRDDPNIN